MRTIKFTESYENLISRIPGLFAYVEMDDKGISTLHKASDSPMGCYGKIVENIIYCDIETVLTNIRVNNIIILPDGRKIEIGKTYSYKTLMNIYYQYLGKSQEIDGFDKFVKFIEYGIGKVEVNYEGLDRKENDLVPHYVYLATVNSLYEELLKLQIKCQFYEQHKANRDEIDNETEVDLCCKCVLYKRKGGDDMLNFLKGLFAERDRRIDWWFNNVSNEKLCLNYSVNLFGTEKDMGILTPIENKQIKLQNGIQYDEEWYEQCDFKHNEDEEEGETFQIQFSTNSKLKSLRRFKTYLNRYDEEERPDKDKDWLFYYRVNQICNLSVLNDDYGNIQTVETNINDIVEGTEVIDLMAYGDVITDIKLDNEKKTLTFTYWTDVHLKAACNGVSYDDDRNKKVTYGDFVIDENDTLHGVKYIETYEFDENSELNEISQNAFDSYIKGENDHDGKGIYKPFEKYEFSTYNNIRFFEKEIGYNKVKYNDIVSDNTEVNIRRDDCTDIQKNDIVRLDFYNGVSYSPTENIDVNIDRGTTSVFDKHIRFSEVKTLQDMEEFMNGSFFNMQ